MTDSPASPAPVREQVISQQVRFVFRMTAVLPLIRIWFCRMRTCRQQRARGTSGRLFGFVMCPRMFRWWASHRFVIHGGPCGVRKVQQIRDDSQHSKKVPDIPISDIRDEQTLSNTQREDWLLPTEPMHGARPRQTGRERPPVIDNPALKDAAGNSAVWNPVVAWTADFEGRGGIHTAEGGRPVPEPQGVPREVRDVPKPFPDGFQEDKLRDGGQNIGSPVDMLVDTVSRRRKCRGLTELLVGNNIIRCLRRLYGRTAGTMIQQHCNCSRI